MKKFLVMLWITIFIGNAPTSVISCNIIDSNNISEKKYDLKKLNSIYNNPITVSAVKISNVTKRDVAYALIPFISKKIEKVSQDPIENKIDYTFGIYSNNKGAPYKNLNLVLNNADDYIIITALTTSKYLLNSTSYIEVFLSQ